MPDRPRLRGGIHYRRGATAYATDPHRLIRTVLDADINIVPGDSPVPITVARTPAADPTGDMSPRLAARLLSAHTRRGDAVHDVTADPVFAQAIGVAGRHRDSTTPEPRPARSRRC